MSETVAAEVMTVQQCAGFIQRKRAALYEYMRRQKNPIPVHRIGDEGHPLFIKTEVLAWLAQQ